jgi:hypothetical protein
MVMALLQRAQCQHGLRPCEAPPRPCALHPVLDHGTTRRLHATGPHGPAHHQVLVGCHPAPVVVEAPADRRAGLPHRLAERPLRQDLSPSTDDSSHPAAEHRGPRGLHPAVSGPRTLPAPGVGRAPEVADDRHAVQDTRHALPRLEARGRQAPQAAGLIAPDHSGCAVVGISALGVGLDARHHRRRRPHPAGPTPERLKPRRVVRHVVPLPARAPLPARPGLPPALRARVAWDRPWRCPPPTRPSDAAVPHGRL